MDVYDSIISLDGDNPEIVLISPSNLTTTTSKNLTFKCNVTDLSLKNITFYLWNSSSLINETSLEISGDYYELEVNISDMTSGGYNWTCSSYDEANNYFISSNFTLTINEILTELISPENNSQTNQELLNFTCNVTSIGSLKNITFYLWNSSNVVVYNETKNISGITNSSYFEVNFTNKNLTEQSYLWNCLVFDELNYSSDSGSNSTLVYDLTSPLIENVSTIKDHNSATITWQTDEETNSSIELITKENKSISEYSSQHSFSFSSLSASTYYQYNITNCDLAGNCNHSSGELTTDSAPVTPSGGVGGSTTPTIYSP
jgi:hypothetical protein